MVFCCCCCFSYDSQVAIICGRLEYESSLNKVVVLLGFAEGFCLFVSNSRKC